MIKTFLKTWFFGSIGGISAMMLFANFAGYKFYFFEYFYPVWISLSCLAMLFFLAGLFAIVEDLKILKKIFSRDTPIVISPEGKRVVPVNNSRGTKNVFLSSKQTSNFDIVPAKAWIIYLTGNVVPVKRKKPFVIKAVSLEVWLKMCWDRQNNPETKHTALSRTYWVNETGTFSTKEYYAYIALAGPAIWGREKRSSGYLKGRPSAAMRHITSVYPVGSTIKF